VARLVVNPRVLCCFLRQSLTEASSLHRHYPASSVLQASPSPQAAQPASHEVPVDRQGDHRWGFPCCYWSTLPTCRRHYPGRSDGTRSLVLFHQRRPAHITRGEGSCVNRFEACSAFTSRYGLHARQVTYVTLYTGGSDGFVSSTAAPIASGWSEPSSRAGLSPAVDQRFSRRTRNRELRQVTDSDADGNELRQGELWQCVACQPETKREDNQNQNHRRWLRIFSTSVQAMCIDLSLAP
jgi:hypothetical protein